MKNKLIKFISAFIKMTGIVYLLILSGYCLNYNSLIGLEYHTIVMMLFMVSLFLWVTEGITDSSE